MTDPTITLPFLISDLFAGFARGTGVAKASPSELILEFQIKDNLLSVLKTGVKEIHIPRAEIDSVLLKRGWFGAKVRIRVKSMKLLAGLPRCDGGEITLEIARRHRDQAAEFASALSSN